MPCLTFYRQSRLDGGLRTGVEVDGETILGLFEAGAEDEDPVLSWWLAIDVRGEPLPDRPESARKWLLDHADDIRGSLMATAGCLDAGLDVDAWPHRSPPMVSAVEGGEILITITCAASRRLEGQHLPDLLIDVSERWVEILADLPASHEYVS